MSDWYGPDDVWPEHPQDFWRAALRGARDHGWFLHREGHWGRVVCDQAAAHDQRCEKPIYSTGRQAENHARQLGKMVQRCPHQEGRVTLGDINSTLDSVDRLVDAAERCLWSDEHFERAAQAEALLEAAEESVQRQEALLNESLVEEQAAQQDLERVVAILEEADERVVVQRHNLPQVAVSLLTTADGRAAEARVSLLRLAPNAARNSGVQRCRELLGRIRLLRDQLPQSR